MTTRPTESKTLTKKVANVKTDCKCKCDGRKYNSSQTRNKNMCQCECKNPTKHICKKD